MVPALVELRDARRMVLEATEPLGHESLGLADALGRSLWAPVTAIGAVPAFDGSSMDGFAVRARDLTGATPARPVVLSVVGESSAGHPSVGTVAAGQAMAIATGAEMPRGADTVVRVEDTCCLGEVVEVRAEAPVANNVRFAGEDLQDGQALLGAGTTLGPIELGVIAAAGHARVCCHRRPRVRVLMTGDELSDPGAPARPGAVRNSNGYSVPALARRSGAEVLGVGLVGDDPQATTAAIEEALAADVTVICGGLSVGRHDHVRESLALLGAEQHFYGLALRPGKPTWFGVRDRTLIFGLPGNPVSATVTFILLVSQALRALSGRAPEPSRLEVRLTEDVERLAGRAQAVRCRLERRTDGWWAEPTGPQGSHVLTSMLGAHALALIPMGAGSSEAGSIVEAELLEGAPAA